MISKVFGFFFLGLNPVIFKLVFFQKFGLLMVRDQVIFRLLDNVVLIKGQKIEAWLEKLKLDPQLVRNLNKNYGLYPTTTSFHFNINIFKIPTKKMLQYLIIDISTAIFKKKRISFSQLSPFKSSHPCHFLWHFLTLLLTL